ncbi:membrane protein [Longimycelium tulufanense]|uniref:Membrane protein n=1 Tax=Longimycelium tulufanense TaxID=907463 RepID=A0A8J3CEC5_9PSEU|nr:protein kinase family protein [Longimycelium tulufanense]GGM66771.1 membrane protein [Longimycelium tulufanense]
MTGKPTDYAMPRRDRAAQSRAGLVPGAILGEGRYRLLSRVGTDHRCNAEFWRARDGSLGRDVAMTVLVGEHQNVEVAGRARKSLERATHICGFIHPGMARVLDVLSPSKGDPAGVLGMVVAEWTQGTDLVDLVADGPLPAGTAARLLEPLAAAVEAAHHVGLVLGADHPQRIRVTPEGELRLAFPGPRPDSTPRDDVRAVGASLYLLLTGRWALPGGPNSLPTAPMGPDGTVVAPSTLRPVVPHQLSTIAVRSLVDTSIGGVRTGAAVLQVLEQAAAAEAETAMLRAIQERGGPNPTPEEQAERERERQRRRKLLISVAVLTVATIAVIAFVGMQAVSLVVGDDKHSAPPLVVGQGPTGTSGQPAPRVGPKVGIASVDVVTPPGTGADNAATADRVIDGDPGTWWRTEVYKQQFPAFKNGVGLLLRLTDPAPLSKVTIDSPSKGTKVRLVAVDSPDAKPEDGTVLAERKLEQERTEIRIDKPERVRYLLVWITELADENPGYQSAIGEVVPYARG